MFDWPHEIRGQFAAHFLGQMPHFLVQRAVAELEIMIYDEVLDLPHLEWDAYRDAQRSHGQQLDYAIHTNGPVRSDPFQGGQTNHLGTIEKQVPRTAFAGIYYELGH